MERIGRRGFLKKSVITLPALAIIGLGGAASARPSTACEGCSDACFTTCKDSCDTTCKDGCRGDCQGNCKGDCTGSSKP